MKPRTLVLVGMVLWLVLVGLVHAGTVTYVYTDPQGTPLAEADAHGNITARFDYSPYGSIALGTAPNGPGYTGHVNDPETGLIYMQQRYDSPSEGRFLSPDPVGVSPGDVFSFSRYAYTDNNPVMNTDPTGMFPGNVDECANSAFPCFVSGSDVGGGTLSHHISVDDAFAHYTTNSLGVGRMSTFPKETRNALVKIMKSPVGIKIVKKAVSEGEKIKLALMPSNMDPEFHWDAIGNSIVYSLDVAKFISERGKDGELKGVGLDTLILHEMGHTPYAAEAFGYRYVPNFSRSNEFDVVRNVENPYRKFIGVPLRATYSGYPVPLPVIIQR